jgi:hypothetical protein
VLTDERPDWRPHEHRQTLWGCEASLQFPTVKLLDYRHRQALLETESNPFAVLTLSHLKAQETRHDPAQRYVWKLRLIKSLYRRGYAKQDILELFRFIDWLLELPEVLFPRSPSRHPLLSPARSLSLAAGQFRGVCG